jgi:hypothetical protein
MVSTNDKKGGVSIYVKNPGKEGIQGLVILAKRKSGEATFVNIVGKLDLKSLSKIGGKFNIPNMHNMENFTVKKNIPEMKKIQIKNKFNFLISCLQILFGAA